MIRLAILADDLTGALDSAAPLAVAGPVPVATTLAALPDALAAAGALGGQVIAVSTRARAVTPAEAARRLRAALAALPPDVAIFKKIDSRLKGNIAAELDCLPDRPLLVAPAIPEFGRIVRDGQVTGFGVDRPIPVAARLGAAAARALIPDTETPDQMAAALRAAPPGAILVGARGLAQALAATLDPTPFHASAPDPAPQPQGPLRLAVGSRDPITLAQIDALRDAWPGLRHVPAPAGRLPQPSGDAGAVLLRIVPGPAEEGLAPDRIAARFARGAAGWLAGAGTLVLSGGETAEMILDHLGIGLLHLRAEALPGLPLCSAAGRVIVTKSGGFGAPDTLVRLCALLSGGA